MKKDKVKLPKVLHSGKLRISDIEIPCCNLDNGMRIISVSGTMKALGRKWQGKKKDAPSYPIFLSAKNLEPFISSRLKNSLAPVFFRRKSGITARGYNAQILPLVCETYLEAREEGALVKNQLTIAARCQQIVNYFSELGIYALIDEATGYQEYRKKNELQTILDDIVNRWEKAFPDNFYREIYRLKGWPYNPHSSARPGYLGTITNDIVYSRISQDLLKELQETVPKSENGNRLYRYHQRLTRDAGNPLLRERLSTLITLMRLNDTWEEYYEMLNRAFPITD